MIKFRAYLLLFSHGKVTLKKKIYLKFKWEILPKSKMKRFLRNTNFSFIHSFRKLFLTKISFSHLFFSFFFRYFFWFQRGKNVFRTLLISWARRWRCPSICRPGTSEGCWTGPSRSCGGCRSRWGSPFCRSWPMCRWWRSDDGQKRSLEVWKKWINFINFSVSSII